MIKGTREVEIEEGENSSSIRTLFVFLEMESPLESSYYGSHLDLINIPLRLKPIPPPLLGKCREERGGWIDCQFIIFSPQSTNYQKLFKNYLIPKARHN